MPIEHREIRLAAATPGIPREEPEAPCVEVVDRDLLGALAERATYIDVPVAVGAKRPGVRVARGGRRPATPTVPFLRGRPALEPFEARSIDVLTRTWRALSPGGGSSVPTLPRERDCRLSGHVPKIQLACDGLAAAPADPVSSPLSGAGRGGGTPAVPRCGSPSR